MNIELSEDELGLLRGMFDAVQFPGKLLDIAYLLKKKLESASPKVEPIS